MTTEVTMQDLIASLRDCRETMQSNATRAALSVLDAVYENIERETTSFLHTKQQELAELQQSLSNELDTSTTLKKELFEIQSSSDTSHEDGKLSTYAKELQMLEEEIAELRKQNNDKVNSLAEEPIILEQGLKTDALALNMGDPVLSGIDQSKGEEEEEEKEGKRGDDIPMQEVLEDPKAKVNVLKLELFRSLGVMIDPKSSQALVCGSEHVDILPLMDREQDDGSSSNLNISRTQYIWERIGAQGTDTPSGG